MLFTWPQLLKGSIDIFIIDHFRVVDLVSQTSGVREAEVDLVLTQPSFL